VVEKISELVAKGLTSLQVLFDFSKRRLAPLRQRTRWACLYTGLNDGSRTIRGAGSEPSQAELEFGCGTSRARTSSPSG
jgi:hypothetical protein